MVFSLMQLMWRFGEDQVRVSVFGLDSTFSYVDFEETGVPDWACVNRPHEMPHYFRINYQQALTAPVLQATALHEYIVQCIHGHWLQEIVVVERYGYCRIFLIGQYSSELRWITRSQMRLFLLLYIHPKPSKIGTGKWQKEGF